MDVVTRKYPKEEFARRGDAIYVSAVQPRLTPGDHGRFVAVDIETGEYEIDDDRMAASLRLRQRVPLSQTWMVRVGYAYVLRFGYRRPVTP